MNVYEVTYIVIPRDGRPGAGATRENISSASESTARELVRSKYYGAEVRIINSRQIEFGRS